MVSIAAIDSGAAVSPAALVRVLAQYGGINPAERVTEDSILALSDLQRDGLLTACGEWLAGWTGRWELLQSLQSQYRRANRLSFRQWAVVANALIREAGWEDARRAEATQAEATQAATAAPAAEAPVAQSAIRNGYYTVVEGGKHITLRLRPHWEKSEAEAGVQVLGYLTGPSNESSYTNVATVRGHAASYWRRAGDCLQVKRAFWTLIHATDEAVTEAGRAYALASGNCYVCGRLLTDPVSIELGIGPVCRGAA